MYQNLNLTGEVGILGQLPLQAQAEPSLAANPVATPVAAQPAPKTKK